MKFGIVQHYEWPFSATVCLHIASFQGPFPVAESQPWYIRVRDIITHACALRYTWHYREHYFSRGLKKLRQISKCVGTGVVAV